MKLGVSNIAWAAEHDEAAFALLAELGVTQIELAPGRIAPWADLTPERADAYREMLAGHGLTVSSLQAIYFGTEGLSLLGEEAAFDALRAHTVQVAEAADALGCRPGVFGAPGLKKRGEMPLDEANVLAQSRLQRIGEAMEHTGFLLGLEPVPPYYGADYLTGTTEILEMVERVDHPNIGLHLDISCVELGGDDIARAIREAGNARIHHFHIAEQDLSGFSDPQRGHAKAAEALREIGYDKAAVIEMKTDPEDWAGRIRTAVSFAKSIYGPDRCISAGRPAG